MIAKTLGILVVSVAPILLGVGSPPAHAGTDEQPSTGAAISQLSELSSSTLRGLTTLSGLEPSGIFPQPVLKAMALTVVPLDQFLAFDEIITAESGWRVFAINPTSGAYGLPQALPAFKMGSEGFDWMINPMTQIRWAYRYMNERYGSPNAAWAFWQAHHWY